MRNETKAKHTFSTASSHKKDTDRATKRPRTLFCGIEYKKIWRLPTDQTRRLAAALVDLH